VVTPTSGPTLARWRPHLGPITRPAWAAGPAQGDYPRGPAQGPARGGWVWFRVATLDLGPITRPAGGWVRLRETTRHLVATPPRALDHSPGQLGAAGSGSRKATLGLVETPPRALDHSPGQLGAAGAGSKRLGPAWEGCPRPGGDPTSVPQYMQLRGGRPIALNRIMQLAPVVGLIAFARACCTLTKAQHNIELPKRCDGSSL